MDDTIEELGYRLSLRALDQQERSLDELRARTGTLLAASSIVVSVLGVRSMEGHRVAWLTAFALASFAISVLASLYVLLPKPGLRFSLRGTSLFENEGFAEPTIAGMHLQLAYWLEEFLNENERTTARLATSFRTAAGAVLLEVMLWSVELAT
jgi:hypothetical protein